MLALVCVQGIVGVGIDKGLKLLARLITIARRIVGNGQQVLALDAAFGKERYPACIVIAVLKIGVKRRRLVIAYCVVACGPLGKTDQNPVTRFGTEPYADFLLSIVLEVQRQHSLARMGCGSQFDQRDAVFRNAVQRLPITDFDNLVLATVLHFPPRTVGTGYAVRAGRSLACFVTAPIKEADRYYGPCLAIGYQYRHVADYLATNRGARVVD